MAPERLRHVVWPVSIAGAIMPAYREAGCANGYGILDAPSSS
jgi:hypothetical protein